MSIGLSPQVGKGTGVSLSGSKTQQTEPLSRASSERYRVQPNTLRRKTPLLPLLLEPGTRKARARPPLNLIEYLHARHPPERARVARTARRPNVIGLCQLLRRFRRAGQEAAARLAGVEGIPDEARLE